MHDSIHVVDPPKCHPNTRVAIIQSIIDWAKGVADEKINQKSIIWLNGGAGAGKSAISRSVAERCVEQGLLLGSFFFAAGDATRNHVGGLVATLCYQICRILPRFREIATALIANDPLIFKSSISTQLITLVINPLSSTIISENHSGTTNIPRLIIIDGLDECSETMDQKNLLLALQESTRFTTLVRFLVCSRPENHINAAFGLPQMANIFYKIFLGDDYRASEDIRHYLEDKFKEIKAGHLYKHMLPAAWPTGEMIYDLVEKSSGMFIYASTVIRYIESPGHKPHQRLEAVFNLRPAFKDLPFTQLDALYRHIITKAEDPSKVLDILAFPLLYHYSDFPITVIEVLLQLEQGDAEVTLADLHSVVVATPGKDSNIDFLHKSLADFLSDQQRAGDLYRDPSAVSLQHFAHTITAFSIPYLPETDVMGKSGYLTVNSPEVAYHLREGEVLAQILQIPQDTEPISSDVLQAARQFPMVKFIKWLLRTTDPTGEEPELPWRAVSNCIEFLKFYFQYFPKIISPFAQDKLSPDNFEATMLVHAEQIRQYCEGALSALENDWSDNGQAYFIYVFYHLSPVLRHQQGLLRMCTSLIDLYDPLFRGAAAFGDTIGELMDCETDRWERRWTMDLQRNIGEVQKISYELTKGIKQKAIFAKLSASFCLAPLCNEQNTRQDARRISMIMGTDQRKKLRRERPWRWRQLSRGRSLHNGLGNGMGVYIRENYSPESFLVRLDGKARSYRKIGCFDPIFTIPEYLSFKRCNPRPRVWEIQEKYNTVHVHGGPRCYMHLLELLPHILPLSGRYEPLVTMCRQKCFASISQFWPKKSRRARQAIEAYLQRVDPQENTSEEKNPVLLGDPSQSMALQESNASEGKDSGLSEDPSPSLQSRKDGERPEVQEGVQPVDSQENTSGEFLGLLGDPSVSSQRREDDSEKPEGQVLDIQPFDFNIRPYMHVSIVSLSVLLLLFSAFIVIS
ncbi:hypothetical protein CPC08DRAFT_673434 [Agrocybe pediades]|nr:hypothetical protein CPC08DRAFT_673434 [Agrocybe pediades]